VDAAYIAADVGNYILKEQMKHPEALLFSFSHPYDVQNFHLSTTKHGDIIKKYNEFLLESKDDINELKARYHISIPTGGDASRGNSRD